MAEAGFFHSPNDRDADIARCFVCFKELEGWEPEDNPVYVFSQPCISGTCTFNRLTSQISNVQN